jgi:hypothetical protein
MSSSELIVEMVRHDPLLIVGLLLVGVSGWLPFVVLRRLMESGYKWPGYGASWPMIGTVPVAYLYLKARRQKGWSPWPAYSIWICLITGLVALVAGLFRLPG